MLGSLSLSLLGWGGVVFGRVVVMVYLGDFLIIVGMGFGGKLAWSSGISDKVKFPVLNYTLLLVLHMCFSDEVNCHFLYKGCSWGKIPHFCG